jgi:type IV pilus assembly protein PilB
MENGNLDERLENSNINQNFVDLDNYNISMELIRKINKDIAFKYIALPYKENKGELFIAMENPKNQAALNDLKFITDKKIIPVKAVKEQILEYIKLYYEMNDGNMAIEEIKRNSKSLNIKSFNVEKLNDSPSVRLVNSIISQAISEKASDIHIEPFDKFINVRFRIDGVLHEIMKLPKSSYKSIVIRIKIMAQINITLKMLPQDGKFEFIKNNINYDFRVSSIPTINGEKFVIRILYKSKKGITLDELTYSNADAIRKIIRKPNGIILLTGPTGSGKSTTSYSIIKELNSKEKNIVTIEDPVEFTIENINQINVNKKAGLTFAAGLRSLLRQDPDVILIGEIRDEETAKVAVRAALTGHLVISTLHTNDAPSVVVRLIDMGVKPYLLCDAVVAVIAQRLVRKICPYCKKLYEPNSFEKRLCGLKDGEHLYKGIGCNKCNNSGYIGRIAVFEIMKIDEVSRKIIYKNGSVDELRKHNCQSGMSTLEENAINLIKNGITTVEEYIKVINSEDDFSETL